MAGSDQLSELRTEMYAGEWWFPDQLVEAERIFEGSLGTIEEGLDIDDAELVQLRRACRLLEVGSNLLDQGYYTVVIESAFVAVERTIQFRLIHDGATSPAKITSSH